MKKKAKAIKKIKRKYVRRNSADVSISTIIDQMNTPRPLPMGRQEFVEWSDRIISGAMIPDSAGTVFQIAAMEPQDEESAYKIHYESQQFALANMLMHLGPVESHKPDAFFIHSLRKFAVNQVADTIRKELHEQAKARTFNPQKE